MDALSFLISLDAVLVAMREGLPHILVLEEKAGARLPSGAFEPVRHRTLERGIRSLVKEQTSHSLGYVEQLYSFGDRGRLRRGHACTGGTKTGGVCDSAKPAIMSFPSAILRSHALKRGGQKKICGGVGMIFSLGKIGAAASLPF